MLIYKSFVIMLDMAFNLEYVEKFGYISWVCCLMTKVRYAFESSTKDIDADAAIIFILFQAKR